MFENKIRGFPQVLLTILSIAISLYAWSLLWPGPQVIQIFVSVFLHELAHMAVLYVFGVPTLSMVFLILFAHVIPDKEKLKELNHLKLYLTVLAGPAVNLLLVLLSVIAILLGGDRQYWLTFVRINSLLAFANLLPIGPILDGSKMLYYSVISMGSDYKPIFAKLSYGLTSVIGLYSFVTAFLGKQSLDQLLWPITITLFCLSTIRVCFSSNLYAGDDLETKRIDPQKTNILAALHASLIVGSFLLVVLLPTL